MKLLLILQYYDVKATYRSTCSQSHSKSLGKKAFFFQNCFFSKRL